jgi:hypothetical protein
MNANMARPLSPASLLLSIRFILNHVTMTSSADCFTTHMARSENPRSITPLLPARLELKVSQLHRLRSGGSSPGKSLYFHCPPIFSTSTRYGEIIGLRRSKAPRPRVNAYQRFAPRFGGNFDYGFLQISHWHTQTDGIPPRAACECFFEHPCLHLRVPFSLRPRLDFNQPAK